MPIAATTFNSDLYMVAATVIPVLFVALVLPNGVLARYAVWAKKQRSNQLRRVTQGGALPARRLWGVYRIYDFLTLPVTLFRLFFVMGEISAVLALDHRHATRTEHRLVMASLIVMPIIAVLSAIAATSFAWAKDLSDAGRARAVTTASDPAAESGSPD
jgi:hypothetical protein